MSIELGKPADYGQFILQRRYELAYHYAGNALDRGGCYLDVGCGNGAQTVLFAQHFHEWIAIDVESARLEEFRRELFRGEYRAAKAKHRIEEYNGNRIPLEDRSVDCLTCIEVIEHASDDKALIAELFRVLKPGGTGIITVPNKWWIFETHGANLPILPWNRVPFFSWLPKSIHERYAKARIYTKSRIESLLKDQGFRIVHSRYVTAPMDMIKQPTLQKVVRNALFKANETKIPLLATSVMLIVTRPE